MITYNDLNDIEKSILDEAYKIYKENPSRYEKLTHGDLLTHGATLKLDYDSPEWKAFNHLFEEELLFHLPPLGAIVRYGLSPDGIKLMKSTSL